MASDESKPEWHARDGAEAAAALGVDAALGLPAEEALRRLREAGPNALAETPPRSPWALILRQFASPLIYLLFGAAALALALGEVKDAVVIVVVVSLNAAIGAIQESRAERSLAALRRLAATRTRVLRDGVELDIDAREVVPGDVALLAAGDAVPADARVLDAASLQIAEAALTGAAAGGRS
jgi:magnesium-transporting ATPase (P-type)